MMQAKRFISLLSTLLVSLASFAQVGEPRNDFSIGFTGGCTLNRMDFQPAIKQTMKGAPMVGFATRYVCEKYFTAICGVQLEVQLNNLGWKELIEDGTDNTYSRDWYFVEVPILMQMGWGRERRGFKFIFEAGPQLGMYMFGKEHRGGEWDISHRPNNVTYQYGKEPDNKFDYGIAAGLGLEFSSPVGHFQLQGRYYYGLGDIFDNSKAGDFGRSANQTISIKLTYLFDLVKTKNPDIR